MSPALEGGFFTTGPPGKSLCMLSYWRNGDTLFENLVHGAHEERGTVRVASFISPTGL